MSVHRYASEGISWLLIATNNISDTLYMLLWWCILWNSLICCRFTIITYIYAVYSVCSTQHGQQATRCDNIAYMYATRVHYACCILLRVYLFVDACRICYFLHCNESLAVRVTLKSPKFLICGYPSVYVVQAYLHVLIGA